MVGKGFSQRCSRFSLGGAALNGNGPVRASTYEDPKFRLTVPYADEERRVLLVARIPLPGTADLNQLKNLASRAGYMFTPATVTGDSGLVTMRIEFFAIDADGDGNTTGPNDGYFRSR